MQAILCYDPGVAVLGVFLVEPSMILGLCRVGNPMFLEHVVHYATNEANFGEGLVDNVNTPMTCDDEGEEDDPLLFDSVVDEYTNGHEGSGAGTDLLTRMGGG